jgi:Iap family predicted aminopeptidase
MNKNSTIEKEIKKYNQIKIDLLKISKCIECCEEKKEEEMYQNIALEYSKELRNIKEYIEKEYKITFCNSCCKF